MAETNREIQQEPQNKTNVTDRTPQEVRAAHDMIAASPEILAATLEGLEQIRRGDYVRVSPKKN